MSATPNIAVILPAGGSGKRFGQTKQFLPLLGTPILQRTISVFLEYAHPQIKEIIVPVPAAHLEEAKEILQNPRVHVVAGGLERQDSVHEGFKKITAPCDIVMVHDGVRPLVTQKIIQDTLEAAIKTGAAIIGVPAKDTLKRVTPDGLIQETIDPSVVWQVQTPQAFHYTILQKAFEKAYQTNFQGTDEAMLVENLGLPIHVVLGNARNLKITTPEDMVLAEAILKSTT